MAADLVERLREHTKAWPTAYGSDRDNIALLTEATDALVAAAADKRRLDWLADRDNPIGNVQLPNVCVMNNLHSLRAAIDEAMRLDPEIYAELEARNG